MSVENTSWLVTDSATTAMLLPMYVHTGTCANTSR